MASTLGLKLQDAQIEWPPNGNRYFIPIDVLNDLITKHDVIVELRRIYPDLEEHKISSYADSICTSSKKIFAILLCTIKCKFICPFLDEGITDNDLPFVRYPPKSQTFVLCKSNHGDCQEKVHRDCGIKAMSSWKQREIKDLCRDQWLVQAPVFEKVPGEIQHHELNDNVVLPYIEDQEGEQETRIGGFSVVWGIRIHSAHQRVYRSTSPQVVEPLLAIKRLVSLKKDDFKKECDMLTALAIRDHPHLVKLLATYKFRGHYHLVFPYANTNLRGYWNDTGLPNWNRDTYWWFICQIKGLASGLNEIHNFKTNVPSQLDAGGPSNLASGRNLLAVREEEKFGRHGDIKPENILWINELDISGREGILQIADMGLGKFHRAQSRSAVDPVTLSFSPTYTAPEVDLKMRVSRAYDMWSLGCVFLEFITWLLEGPEKIYTFSSERGLTGSDGVNDDLYFTLATSPDGVRTAVIREKVILWIARLKTNPRCSVMVAELLKIVETQLLIIDSKRRVSAMDLKANLELICNKAKDNEEYLLGKNPPVLDPDAGVKLPQGSNTKYPPTIIPEYQEFEGTNDSQSMDIADAPTIEVHDCSEPTSPTSFARSSFPPVSGRSASAVQFGISANA